MTIATQAHKGKVGTGAPRARCVACGEPLTPIGPSNDSRLHPTCSVDPDVLASELFSIVGDAITNMPRTLQKRIGPSEIGIPCERRIGHILAGTPVVNEGKVAWKAWVGSAVHEQLADVFARTEVARWGDGTDDTITPRWWAEERVHSGLVLGDVVIDGTCDLFDGWHGAQWDWKVTTKNKIREMYRPHGPGEQYRVQAHDYGLGWARRGFDVRTVGIVFLARDGEFTDRHVWTEPFDPTVALAAHQRVQRVQNALDALGPRDALPMLATSYSWCSFCPWFKKNTPAGVARSCPGVPDPDAGNRVASTPFDDLLPKESK